MSKRACSLPTDKTMNDSLTVLSVHTTASTVERISYLNINTSKTNFISRVYFKHFSLPYDPLCRDTNASAKEQVPEICPLDDGQKACKLWLAQEWTGTNRYNEVSRDWNVLDFKVTGSLHLRVALVKPERPSQSAHQTVISGTVALPVKVCSLERHEAPKYRRWKW